MTAASARRTVMVGGDAVTTFADEQLFAYLRVHGTRHAWLRLKWLSDLVAFLASRSLPEIEQLHAAALRLGAGRGPDVALTLLHLVLDAPVPHRFCAPPSDRITRWLVANAVSAIGHGGGAGDCSFYTLPGLRGMASQLGAAPGINYLADEARGKWNSAVDRARIDLSRPLGFLYHRCTCRCCSAASAAVR